VTHHLAAAAESWQTVFGDATDEEEDGSWGDDARAWTLYLARELAALAGEHVAAWHDADVAQ